MKQKIIAFVDIVQSKFSITPREKTCGERKTSSKNVANFSGIHWMVLGFLRLHHKIIVGFNLSTTIVSAAQFYAAYKVNRAFGAFSPLIVSCNC